MSDKSVIRNSDSIGIGFNSGTTSTPISFNVSSDICQERTRQQILQDYEIRIRFLSIGCVVDIGCKSIPFTNVDEAISSIKDYVTNPEKAREKWEKLF